MPRNSTKKFDDVEESELFTYKPKRKFPQNSYTYSRWNPQENRQYARFLIKYREVFESCKGKRLSKVFVMMSDELTNGRNNQQCRSHHLKMTSKFGNLEKIIQGILGELEEDLGKSTTKISEESFKNDSSEL